MTEKYYRREKLVGKEVYDADALHVGTAKDVAYSTDGKTALVVSKGKKEETIPFQNISEIGDIILLKRQPAKWDDTAPRVEGKATEPMLKEDKPETKSTATPSYWKEAIKLPLPDAQGPSVLPTKTCPKCRRENKPTAKFCVKCGHKFS